jgi:hypothetical protein
MCCKISLVFQEDRSVRGIVYWWLYSMDWECILVIIQSGLRMYTGDYTVWTENAEDKEEIRR